MKNYSTIKAKKDNKDSLGSPEQLQTCQLLQIHDCSQGFYFLKASSFGYLP